MKYDVNILLSAAAPIRQAKATLSNCRTTVSGISIPSDFSHAGTIRAASGKITNIISMLSSGEVSINATIQNLIATSAKNDKIIEQTFNAMLGATQILTKSGNTANTKSSISSSIDLPTKGEKKNKDNMKKATKIENILKKYGGPGFHSVQDEDGYKSEDGYTQVYVTANGKVFPDFRQYTGSNGDGTYIPNSIAEYPFASDNIHGHGCPVCSIESLAYGNGIEKEAQKQKAIKKTADELHGLLNGKEKVDYTEAIEEMRMKGLNPVYIEDTLKNKDKIVDYLKAGKSMVVRVPPESDFSSSGHMMVVPEMIGDNQVVILNSGRRDENLGHSGIYDLDKILFEDGYVIVSDL